MSNFQVKNGQKFVFMGDSITDCGRWSDAPPYGKGYAKMVVDLITAKYPERAIEYVNVGISGNTSADLVKRWEDDVIRLNPDWLTIKIGINDLWASMDKKPTAITPENYRNNLLLILTETKKKTKAKIILIDPFYMSTNKNNESVESAFLRQLPEYICIVEEMSKKFKLARVKTHEIFQKHLKIRPRNHFGIEPVHPNLSGHMIIANELLRVLGW